MPESSGLFTTNPDNGRPQIVPPTPAPEAADARAIYAALAQMFSDPDRDVHGSDLVEALGTIIAEPGKWNVRSLFAYYGLLV